MIAIETADGELVKVLHNIQNAEFGLHKLFGFISKEGANKREETRKRQGYDFTDTKWHCAFHIEAKADQWQLSKLSGCQAKKLKEGVWSLTTPMGQFKLSSYSQATLPADLSMEGEDKNIWINKTLEYVFLAIFLLTPIFYLMQREEVVEEKKEDVVEHITVQVIEPVNTVNIAQNKPDIKVKPISEAERAKRAVQKNLGFLGLVGSKNLKDVVGGAPTELKQATAGAGPGGDAGSGGEVLAGLGKGIKKITVGNTGVAGLGGVGTKGAGGGKGGYGNTLIASGEGKGISAISVSSSEMVLDGGLSRYAINATIAKYINQVRRCYEDELKSHPSLEGLVTVGFQINGSGRLNYSNVTKSSLGNKTVEKCITTKMMNWQFPKPKGGVNVNVNYPFMLRPVGT